LTYTDPESFVGPQEPQKQIDEDCEDVGSSEKRNLEKPGGN
jgi:hypothetical protein